MIRRHRNCLFVSAVVVFFAHIAAAQDPGDRVKVNALTIACPQKPDLLTFMDAYNQAVSVNDQIGKKDAIHTAFESGCQVFASGDTGLLIDIAGFLEPVDELRMDSDQNAYWFPADAISPLGSQ